MSLEGSIKDFGLSDIFQLIYVQQKSGLMTIDHQSHKATVGFVKGIVVSEGFLSPEDLKRVLKLQTLEAVYRLFRWKEGQYSFDQQQVSYPKEYTDPISTEHILMEGVRRLDEWPYIEKKIPSLGMVFAPVPERQGEIDQVAAKPAPQPSSPGNDDPFADLDPEPEGRFSQAEITVYRAVNGTHPVSRLIDLVQLGEFEVCKSLANLLTAGLIVPVGVSEVTEERGRRWAGAEKVLAGAVATFWWIANVVFIAAVLAALAWGSLRAKDQVLLVLERELQSIRVVLLPHHLKTLEDLVRVWQADHGSLPTSVLDPISSYGASTWPLSDPWGKSWIYDPVSGTVSIDSNVRKTE